MPPLTPTSRRLLPRLAALMVIWFSTATLSLAQTIASGAISGKIFNKDTGEYVRNADVRIAGSNLAAISADEGFYRLSNVPAGEVTLVLSYLGYPSVTATVQVSPNATATHDFEISTTTSAARPADGGVVQLEAFQVSGYREGESKSLMQQRNTQDITNIVSSESFGDVSGGNIGEFMKNVPGVDIDVDRGASTTIRLRGLPTQYASVTLDGVSMANADGNSAVAPNTRALNFSSFSLSSLEAIEISKTVSADVDANAPAGTINLRPKRAFDRRGRRVEISAHVTVPSSHFSLEKSNGPTDRQARKIHPSASVHYSDVVFNKRLGFNLSLNASEQFNNHSEVRHTNNYAATAADPRPVVPTLLNFSHTPRLDSQKTVNFTADFKATPNLVLSLGLLFNNTQLLTWQRDFNFNLGARSTVIGTDPLTSFITSASASVVSSPTAILKVNQSMSAIPKFEYRRDNLKIEGRFMISDAMSWYDPWGRGNSARDLLGGTGPTNSGVTYTGTRSSPIAGDWQITQLAGPDWNDGANYTTGVLRYTDGRGATTASYSGDVTASLDTRIMGIPIVWKTGVKRFSQNRTYRNTTSAGLYTLNGAPARGGWAQYRSPFEFEFGGDSLGASVTGLNSGKVWVPNLEEMGALLRNSPERFTYTLSAANFYASQLNEARELDETLDAAFLMATATLGKATLRAGLRWEGTETDVLERDRRTSAEVIAAGYAIDPATGRATTVAGLEYQYFSKPQVHRVSTYGNYFPSASLKYKFARDIDLTIGFSSTIQRPTYGDMTAVWVINEITRTVTAPNVNLRPEKSQNFSVRLAKYFEPTGQVAVNFFQNTIDGLFERTLLTAEEFGPTDFDFDFTGYTFSTTRQSTSSVTVRGMELEYSQLLSFLPAPLDGLSVRASYTRTYADRAMLQLVPHSITGGLNYKYRKFSTYANWTWRDTNYQALGTINRVYRHEGRLDIGGTYKFTSRWSAYFAARNVLNAPRILLEQSGNSPWVNFGYFTDSVNWTFGGRYVF
jgi:iron complex outermembrane receptor protein